ncbi:MAG TPA: hypothetical protein VLE73_01110 [Candidatus Saccharimonadales bacterium]|nr:hypothetical protein [Candidatus Saccharimonadales bacterium]
MQPKSIFILGRQPAIGRAELESLFGAEHVQPLGTQAMASDIAADAVPFARLGGSIRVAKALTRLDTADWPTLLRAVAKELPQLLDYLPEGKLKLGLSAFGLNVSSQQLFRSGLELKKVCKKAGRSVRLVPNTEPALSSAQVLHNQLAGELGIELLLVSDGVRTWLAQTTAVQDITAYAKRDQGRPKRDAKVGMLPPKLAQTILNLAASNLPTLEKNVILDPFCGTGVVLQEALLTGYGAYGTDLEPRMIDYSRQNLEWLATHGVHGTPQLEPGDATTHQWGHPFAAVASEVYLGRPLSSWPGPDTLQEIMGACNVILEKFLRNLATQTQPGLRLCLAVPAWKAPNGHIHHLAALDHLEKMGYNRLQFEHAPEDELVYYRPEQTVARELLVIIRK